MGIMTVLISLWFLNPAQATVLKSGDLIFISLTCRACPLIKKTTRSAFSHMGILEVRGDEDVFVIHAISPRVTIEPFQKFLARTKKPAVIMRMKSFEGQQVAARAAQAAKRYLGRPYDVKFRVGEDAIYCSELIYYSFMVANNNQPVFPLIPMTFKPYEEEWHQLLGPYLPEGEPGSNPGDISRSPQLAPFRQARPLFRQGMS